MPDRPVDHTLDVLMGTDDIRRLLGWAEQAEQHGAWDEHDEWLRGICSKS